MIWWMWIVLGCALLLLEIATPGGFYFIFFGASALLVGFLTAAGLTSTDWVEWLLFSVFAIGATAVFRKPLLQKFGASTLRGEVDTLVGETATATEPIQPGGFGKAELRGTSWNACNASTESLVRGQRCRVERVDGLTIFVRSAEPGATSN
jgi:membrane protein implicated in regulation of membrane protease activity